MIRLAPLFLLTALASLPVAAQGPLYTREVQVPAAGWVRVPLDLSTLPRLAPDAADLHVLDPRGGEVPRRVVHLLPQVQRVPLQVVGAEPRADRWTVRLDAGPAPLLHQRLLLQLAPSRPVAAVELQGSRDGESWHPLASSALVPSEGGFASLFYPPTEDRYLRLTSPGAPAGPAVAVAEVEAVRGPSLSDVHGKEDCAPGRPGVTVCQIPLPAGDVVARRLTVDLQDGAGAGGAEIGYRLYEPRQARWRLLAEGVWRRGGARTGHLLLEEPRRLRGGMLRLEIFAPGGSPPALAGHGLELAAPAVVFRATAAGAYKLAYGGLTPGRPLSASLPAEARMAWRRAGPEKEGPSQPLAAGAPRPPSWRDRPFLASWNVIAPAARAGALVRLEIADPVYAAARADLGDLRLVTEGKGGEHEIPYARWSPPDPARVAEEKDLKVEGETPQQDGRSREGSGTAEISLPASGLPLTELQITGAGGEADPSRIGSFTVIYAAPSPIRARRRERTAVPRQSWRCATEPPLPCRQTVGLAGPAFSLLDLRLDGIEGTGDRPGLDVAVWRRRDVLLFYWPEEGTEGRVRLLAGSGSLRPPVYDLQAAGPALLSRSWQPAAVDLVAAASSQGPRWGRWVRPFLLLAAAAALLLLLRRILPDV